MIDHKIINIYKNVLIYNHKICSYCFIDCVLIRIYAPDRNYGEMVVSEIKLK